MWQVQVMWQFLSNGLKACVDKRFAVLTSDILFCNATAQPVLRSVCAVIAR